MLSGCILLPVACFFGLLVAQSALSMSAFPLFAVVCIAISCRGCHFSCLKVANRFGYPLRSCCFQTKAPWMTKWWVMCTVTNGVTASHLTCMHFFSSCFRKMPFALLFSLFLHFIYQQGLYSKLWKLHGGRRINIRPHCSFHLEPASDLLRCLVPQVLRPTVPTTVNLLVGFRAGSTVPSCFSVQSSIHSPGYETRASWLCQSLSHPLYKWHQRYVLPEWDSTLYEAHGLPI